MAKKRGRKKSTTKKKTTKKAPTNGRRRGRPPGSKNRTAAASDPIQGAVSNLQEALSNLVAERNRLDAQIHAIEQALASMGGRTRVVTPATGGGRGRRGGAGGSLKDFIERVMAGKGTMRVRDVTDAVLAAGYPTQNKTLAKSVGIALTQMPNVKKKGRGEFELA